jgi:hypothetical protein
MRGKDQREGHGDFAASSALARLQIRSNFDPVGDITAVP